MASTPSASALSAVLRCRRNIWTTPSARLTGNTARDLPVKTASLWDAFTHGERVILGHLAVSCNVPWKKRKAPNVCHIVTQPALVHAQGDAREPIPSVCARPSLRASRAKVVFVCETRGPSLSVCPRGQDTGDQSDQSDQRLWVSVRGACVSLAALLSHFVLGRVLLLFRTGTGQDESTDPGEDAQERLTANLLPLSATPGAVAVVDSCPGGGSVCGELVTEDRPD